ncbi:MAG: hypothetical protein LKF99_01070 [Bifidobacterium sp.]|jgi:hypothetical protein|nr:hypothetical protein [Bifidobacterium sp.]
MDFKVRTLPQMGMRKILRRHSADILIVVAMVFIELFIFNLPHWQTILNTSSDATQVEVGPGLKKKNNGTAIIVDKDKAWLTVSARSTINYLRVNERPNENGFDVVRWTISTKKATDGEFYKANSVSSYSPKYDVSRYIHLGNGTKQVRFYYESENNSNVPIVSFSANPNIPLRFSKVRLFCELFIVLLLVAFRPGSLLYRKKISFRNTSCLFPIFVIAGIQIACAIMLWLVAGGANSVTGFGDLPGTGSKVDYDQYAQTANSLLNGHVHLDIPVNRDLAAMANPYDAPSRFKTAILSQDRNSVLFDVAYKDGKYYSYFGVLPAVILFMPYKLLTARDLPVGPAVLTFAILIILSSALLVVQGTRLLVKRNHKVSLGAVLLLECAIPLGLPLFMVIQQILFYQLPQTCGLVMVFLALSCWIESKMKDLSKGWLAAGSFFMALTLGCRPQLILATLIAPVLFREEIRDLWHRGKINNKEFLNQILAWSSALLPFVIAFIPILEYNKLRFGSLFDFGATYNLTGFDMTHDNRPWTEVIPLAFLYFFQPPYLSTTFPFVLRTAQGLPLWIPMQPSLGGMLTTLSPFAFIILIPVIWVKVLRRARLIPFAVSLVTYALVIFLFDAHSVGYDVRYILDFGWALMLFFGLCLFALDSRRSPLFTQLARDNDENDGREILAPMSDLERTMIGLILFGLIGAWAFSFFSMFQPNPSLHLAPLWWNVSSWFLFI